MTTVTHFTPNPKLLVRGIHLDLSDPAKALIEARAERLFRHEPRILRLRIDVERDPRASRRGFVAKGRIELAGPDLTASVTTDAPSASIVLLIDMLDRMLRKRASALMRRRAAEDIRDHVALAAAG